jgi:hypothetical protein
MGEPMKPMGARIWLAKKQVYRGRLTARVNACPSVRDETRMSWLCDRVPFRGGGVIQDCPCFLP